MAKQKWDDAGNPLNIEAAADDAIQWLCLLARNAAMLRMPRADVESLRECRAALREFIDAHSSPSIEREVSGEDSEALVLAIDAHLDGWKSATFGWHGDTDPVKYERNKRAAIQAHAAECLRRIRETLSACVTPCDGGKNG